MKVVNHGQLSVKRGLPKSFFLINFWFTTGESDHHHQLIGSSVPKSHRDQIFTVKCEPSLFFIWLKFKETPSSLSRVIRKKCASPKVFSLYCHPPVSVTKLLMACQ
ncbi:hypothetical protein AVEN_85015-1 [Araneus ventricosus]|uniref:Uncharacterized protein n=1 Tax=Araneus ventricosus TaxID=182803 RepID=A0A4Y2T024_ARAVE|nr:hypothetical protein AVEN_85015-1 [Araneus ventricosus]